MATQKNPELQKISDGMQAKVPAQLQSDYQRILLAGMKIMFSPQTHPFMVKQITRPGDMVDHVGEYIAGLVGVMYKQSKNTMPLKAGIPAGIALMCEALDFLEKSGKLQITKEVIAQCTKAVAAYIMQKFGATPERLAQARQAKAGQAQPVAAPAAPAPTAPPPARGLLSQPGGM